MSSDVSALRIWHTVRHLRTRQILSQVRHRLHPLRADPDRFRDRSAPAFPGCIWQPREAFLPPGPDRDPARQIPSGRFTFLRRTEQLGWPPRWTPEGPPKLWVYNLHYFDWLGSLDPARSREAVRDWISRHELRRGAVGWEPYPTSVRLLNWISLFFGPSEHARTADRAFLDQLWRSIHLQAEWLLLHPEEHLLGNHLLENAAALAFAGSCFAGPEAERWYHRGRDLLARELTEQILSDGLHFERSPMYHQRMIHLLILLRATEREDLVELVAPFLASMLDALAAMCHPDGGIALFNDSALGIYNDPRELIETGRRLLGAVGPWPPAARGPWALPAAGYYGFRQPGGDYIVCDAGPIGPDYIPGHAHGDIFSLEASFSGRRVFVDAGVHDYEQGELRDYCRSTRAHNTLEIEQSDQCEFWGAFRVARRGRPRDVTWDPTADGFRLAGWHDGYCRLPGAPRHHREIVWRSTRQLSIVDEVFASRPVRSVSRLHLHPACRWTVQADGLAEVRHPGGRVLVRFEGEGTLTTEPSRYCPEFGKVEESTALAYACGGDRTRTTIRIECS